MTHRTRATGVTLIMLLAGAATAAIDTHDNLGDFLANTGTTIFENFEGFASGSIVNTLNGVSNLTGVDNGGNPVSVRVTAEGDMPFPMHSGGLPSGTNFLSNDMASPSFATGTIRLDFSIAVTAIGFYVADGSPLDTFNISVYDANGLVGSFDSAAPRTLPDSFFGITGDMAFTYAIIGSNNQFDSWGIDDLYITQVPTPAGATLLGIGGLALARRRR